MYLGREFPITPTQHAAVDHEPLPGVLSTTEHALIDHEPLPGVLSTTEHALIDHEPLPGVLSAAEHAAIDHTGIDGAGLEVRTAAILPASGPFGYWQPRSGSPTFSSALDPVSANFMNYTYVGSITSQTAVYQPSISALRLTHNSGINQRFHTDNPLTTSSNLPRLATKLNSTWTGSSNRFFLLGLNAGSNSFYNSPFATDTIGFQNDTGNWIIKRRRSSVNLSDIDTGVASGTTVILLISYTTSTDVDLTIYDGDGTNILYTTTISGGANLPLDGSGWHVQMEWNTDGSATSVVDFSYLCLSHNA